MTASAGPGPRYARMTHAALVTQAAQRHNMNWSRYSWRAERFNKAATRANITRGRRGEKPRSERHAIMRPSHAPGDVDVPGEQNLGAPERHAHKEPARRLIY